jgi:AraC-like DNA-binding protein
MPLDIVEIFMQVLHLYSYMNIYSERTDLLKRINDWRPVRSAHAVEVLVSYSHTPSAVARRVFNVVLQSGHFRASRGCRMERCQALEHELLYCVNGRGSVFLPGRQFRVRPSNVVWLSGNSYWTAETEPCEALWMRIEGHHVEQAWGALSVQASPVFEGLPKEETRQVFHRVNDLLLDPSLAVDTALNESIAQLLGFLVESREATRPFSERDIQDSYPELRSAFIEIAADSQRSWRAGELAKLCGLSERHFFRRFKEATGLAPMNWLKVQRISLAQTKLRQSGHSIKQIAGEVGYNDVFFFSRDFKRHTGACPTQYRREHSSVANRGAPAALA